tara:strand:+ start:1077 stop:1718 length:642 start_codon:yes stop_codon:yes gene_type:complete
MNYGTLKTHFNNLLNRSDITTDLTEKFIDMGQGRVQRQLRTPMQEKLQTYTISGQTAYLTLPIDFIETISIHYGNNELSRVPMSKFRSLNAGNYSGNPTNYTRQQEKIYLFPQPSSGTFNIYYYAEFDTMSSDSDENTLAKVAPDLLIYSALTYAADYYLDERNELFETKFNQFMLEVQEQANDQETNGGVQAIQPSMTYTDYQDSYSSSSTT